MLILDFLMSILSRHSRHPCIPNPVPIASLRFQSSSLCVLEIVWRYEAQAISDLLKCKYLRKNANNSIDESLFILGYKQRSIITLSLKLR